jgi:sec-independent protein translocase protein TatB
MKIFNVGALEILFIILLALIVLGPKNAVKALGDLGTWLKKIKESQIWQDLLNTSREIQELPKKMMDETEIKKTLEEINRSTGIKNTSIKTKALNDQVDQVNFIDEENHQIHPPSEDHRSG